jgi:hypothetical protein
LSLFIIIIIKILATSDSFLQVANMSSKLKEYLHVDYKPGERRLVQKIDFFILTFCCLSYFVNYVRCHTLIYLFDSCTELTDSV